MRDCLRDLFWLFGETVLDDPASGFTVPCDEQMIACGNLHLPALSSDERNRLQPIRSVRRPVCGFKKNGKQITALSPRRQAL
jgi:hypothetical protein